MGRLIDADALIEKLKRASIFEKITNAEDKNVFAIIDDMPTAYDLEKVVAGIREQFGCKDCEYADVFPTPNVCSYECAELEVINDICDIVKAGGINE